MVGNQTICLYNLDGCWNTNKFGVAVIDAWYIQITKQIESGVELANKIYMVHKV